MKKTILNEDVTADKNKHTCVAWTSDNNGAYLCKVCGSEWDDTE